MKRLLCLISAMNAGGAETFLMKVYRQLNREKYQMDFCVNTNNLGVYDKEIEMLGGKIYHIPSKSENLSLFSRELTKIIKNNHYEYVLRVTSSAMGFMDLKIAKKAGATVCVARSSNSSDGHGLKVKFVHQLGKLLYGRYIDVKLAPSDLAARYTFGHRNYENGKVTILHNGVDTSLVRYTSEGRRKIREEFGISLDTKVIGHIGRFTQQKNHDFLLDIFSIINKQEPNAILLLVGTGELEKRIREKIKILGVEKNVFLTGVRLDIPELLSAMDVFVFPSLYEGMPNTVIEAQATGLSCIISDTITKESDITGLIEFLPIKDAARWAELALKLCCRKRKNTVTDLKTNCYDIESVTRQFETLIFRS